MAAGPPSRRGFICILVFTLSPLTLPVHPPASEDSPPSPFQSADSSLIPVWFVPSWSVTSLSDMGASSQMWLLSA